MIDQLKQFERIAGYPPRRIIDDPSRGRMWECTSSGCLQVLLFPESGDMDAITVHYTAGERWDGATIPAFLRCLIGDRLDDDWASASYVHDRFCDRSRSHVVRQLGDVLFWHLLRINPNVPRWKRLAMFVGVRAWSILMALLRR